MQHAHALHSGIKPGPCRLPLSIRRRTYITPKRSDIAQCQAQRGSSDAAVLLGVGVGVTLFLATQPAEAGLLVADPFG